MYLYIETCCYVGKFYNVYIQSNSLLAVNIISIKIKINCGQQWGNKSSKGSGSIYHEWLQSFVARRREVSTRSEAF